MEQEAKHIELLGMMDNYKDLEQRIVKEKDKLQQAKRDLEDAFEKENPYGKLQKRVEAIGAAIEQDRKDLFKDDKLLQLGINVKEAEWKFLRKTGGIYTTHVGVISGDVVQKGAETRYYELKINDKYQAKKVWTLVAEGIRCYSYYKKDLIYNTNKEVKLSRDLFNGKKLTEFHNRLLKKFPDTTLKDLYPVLKELYAVHTFLDYFKKWEMTWGIKDKDY